MSAPDCPCGRATDGKRPMCCTYCSGGQHTVACGIRQIGAGRAPTPVLRPAVELRVRAEVGR